MDSEPPIKKSKSNGAMKDEKPFITDTQADMSEEVPFILATMQENWSQLFLSRSDINLAFTVIGES